MVQTKYLTTNLIQVYFVFDFANVPVKQNPRVYNVRLVTGGRPTKGQGFLGSTDLETLKTRTRFPEMEERIGRAEVEKPFKCTVCSSYFTNEDHLQVHKRRHEMSLSFTNTKGGPSLGPDGFVDETPTPSRFIRNCEEVGLFQDLNPFDEQFSKATSATPTSENNFGFQFSHKTASADDTLNTPQVFGYGAATGTPLPFTPTTIQKAVYEKNQSPSIIVMEGEEEELVPTKKGNVKIVKVELRPLESTNKSVSSSPENNIVSVLGPNVKNTSGKTTDISHVKKQKSKLRLNIELLPANNSSSGEIILSADSSTKRPESAEKKFELLERNRAAASRSRERRKQWISALEGKCCGLQSDLAKVHSELSKLRAENKILKLELTKHVNCSVTQSQSPIRNKPTILRQVSQTPTIIVTHLPELSSPLINTVKFFNPPQQSQPKLAAKRGRPRKGYEKRAAIVQDIPIVKSVETLKVKIMPVYPIQKSSTQKVFILQS